MTSRTTGSQSNFTIEHQKTLIPLTDCCVEVYAENTCNTLTHSGPEVSTCGRTIDAVPTCVQNLSVISISDHSLLIEWEPPANYARPGLSYSLNVNGQNSSVLDGTHYFINAGLTPSTNYRVKVKAISSVGMSDECSASNTTKPSFPIPPRNVSFSADPGNGNTGPVLDWDTATSATHYKVFWKCNEVNGTNTTETTSIMITNYNTSGDSTIWCTARVQTVNEIGRSDLSDAVSVIIPQSVPPQPTCFLVDNKGSSAVFSFTVTEPFSLHELNVEWQLSNSSANESSGGSNFSNNSLTVPVRRNTQYRYRLRLCNAQGCGDYCREIQFTTNTVSCCIFEGSVLIVNGIYIHYPMPYTGEFVCLP